MRDACCVERNATSCSFQLPIRQFELDLLLEFVSRNIKARSFGKANHGICMRDRLELLLKHHIRLNCLQEGFELVF